jgi:hypothetical protein
MVVLALHRSTKDDLESELQVFCRSVEPDPSIKMIILFARLPGGYHRGSDLDLIIVQETNNKNLSRLEPF